MATQVQNRRGTTAEHSTFTGAVGELTVDTTKDTVVVHDGAVAGGRPLLREDQSNLPTSAPTTGIYSASGSLAISTNSTGRLFVDANGNVSLGTAAATNFANYQTLTLNDTTGAFLEFKVGGTYTHGIVADSSALSIKSIANLPVTFGVNDIERMRLTSTGLGIGSTPSFPFHVTNSSNAVIACTNPTDSATGVLNAAGGGTINVGTASNHPLTVSINSTEAFRVDTSRRLLVGTSSASSTAYAGAVQNIQIQGVNQYANVSVIGNRVGRDGAYLTLGKSRGTTAGSFTSAVSEDIAGAIRFEGANGTAYLEAASLACEIDGTPSGTAMPGRLVFSTTADGASSPTERMRITNDGYFKFTNSGSYRGATSTYNEIVQGSNLNNLFIRCSHASFTSTNLLLDTVRAANSAYFFLYAASGDSADAEFILRGDGQAYADGSWNGGGADYAEYFEWSDSNPDEEDRRGISVVLDGDKIREAVAGEDPIGVISGNPSVVGDSAWNKWSGKYLRDEFGTYIQEDYEVTDDDGNTVVQQRRKLNPAYDPDVEYISREERPEWACVGLMGKLRIRKGQITGSRWIKMRDINDSVEEWLVR